jgi:hypothetical protein
MASTGLVLARDPMRSSQVAVLRCSDLELATDQIAAIDDINTGVRGGPAPETVTPEAFGRDIPEA